MFDRSFYREVRKWFVSLTRLRRYVLFLSSIATPAILGLLKAVSDLSPGVHAFAVPMQVAVLIGGFLLGLGLFWFDETPALIFQKFAQEVRRTEQLESSAAKQRLEFIQLSAHINCLSIAARAVESALLTPSTRDRLEEVVKQLLDNVADQRSPLFGIREEEQWNFAVYLQEGSELHCLYYRRNFGQPGDVPRAWAIGAGHVGLAYQRDGELLTDDVASQEVFQGVGDQQREYDRATYRGVASICVPDVNDGRPIGVLVATSSRVGRFTQGNVQPLRDLAQSIGVILSPRTEPSAAGEMNGQNG
ncbi:GAF domain-containing protein [Bradyrhizobium sp. Tv2a-2]|uniref:GAF domain-containing protein n=1 Tax=Bradyrhizobium sp. Tv2a-2 TaxID=113395 RepID=UPI000466FB8B|nr:GAF domain-containing protein [Bradyrhizobium sp. Tv2a-2]